ncbi:site-specific DNA-methyltransferase [Glaesserella parasuis]|uniref:site-specific DNA-methyltransferase n=1 Tax=Glaesserella parasuis TaxID=738 RepID=UPI001A951F38|nr:site-specific DNA-methyltransferase [Glaesserella parasuis]QSX14729.1 site-specific DNA-methyltransferase [Glaesserella parasuis]
MSQLIELTHKLKEIFQINRADLDFGIYRILNTRSQEIEKYLSQTLPQKVKQALGDNQSEQIAGWQAELEQAKKQAQELGIDPNQSPKVQELQSKIEQAKKGSADHETAVYRHLLTFFSRYYEEGDFISQRRYKGDTYAVPYSGEEVLLHWANKDQYYTKSGENFSNYRFSLNDGRTVFFRLNSADIAKDNRKDNDAKRLFTLATAQTIERENEDGELEMIDINPITQSEDGKTLTILFDYKPFEKSAKQEKILEQDLATLQAHDLLQTKWIALAERCPTEKNPNRTLLEKHLSDYTQKNSADYFIHKDLGGFLRRELDFYIKNEVMNLDDVQNISHFAPLEANLRLIQTLRSIALELIAFLAQLENFQKKLWLKKKFVAGHHYLITLSHILQLEQAGRFIEEIANNVKQLAQWQSLFNLPSADAQAFLNAQKANNAGGGGKPCLNSNSYNDLQHLVVDTSLFSATFQSTLISELSRSLGDFDSHINGTLIHSDNFQALNLLQARYREQVKCIYIDPPYNTEKDRLEGKFIYKDNFAHSSWLTLLSSRLQLGKKLLSKDGLNLISIDDNELHNLRFILDCEFNPDNYIETFSWQKTTTPPNLSKKTKTSCEYILAYHNGVCDGLTGIQKISKSSNGLMNQTNNYGVLVFPANVTTTSKLKNGIYRAGKYGTNSYDIELLEDTEVLNGVFIKPIKLKGRFKWGQNYLDDAIKNGTRIMIQTIAFSPSYEKDEYEPEKPWNIINQSFNVGTNENASAELDDMFYTNFSEKIYPKPVSLIAYLANFNRDNNLTLDYFAGSGTTAHAVINLNREDNGNRQYILVEQGEYFDTVLKPRVQKVIYSKAWKEGKPVVEDKAENLQGVPQIVKVLKLESYEDTLNNLELRRSDLFDHLPENVQQDYLLNYMLNIDSRGSLLNISHFEKPFDYGLNISTTSAGAYEWQKVDLVETFNYLIGAKVINVDDKRAEQGFVAIECRLPNQSADEKTLIFWRDCERIDYDGLQAQFDRLGINPADSEYSQVYVNGDHTLETVWDGEQSGSLKIVSIEDAFLSLMFEGDA